MKKHISLFFLSLFMVSFSLELSAQNTDAVYVPDGTIKLPGDGGHDYLFVDTLGQKLFVTHGISVDVIDLRTNQYLGSVKGLGSVHGVLIDHKDKLGFVSDSRQRALIAFNPETFQVVKTITLKGKDEDAIVYDDVSNRIFVFEGDSHQAEVVDPSTLEQTNVIPLGAKPEFAVSDHKGLIYVNLQSANTIGIIDVKKMQLMRSYDVNPCGAPTALAIDNSNKRLFTGCRTNRGLSVVDMETGKVIQTLPIGEGVDAVKYDPVTHLIFASCFDGSTTIIRQDVANKYQEAQKLPTAKGARTMVIDPKTHKIYLSVSDGDHHNPVPDSFRVLVYKMK